MAKFSVLDGKSPFKQSSIASNCRSTPPQYVKLNLYCFSFLHQYSPVTRDYLSTDFPSIVNIQVVTLLTSPEKHRRILSLS